MEYEMEGMPIGIPSILVWQRQDENLSHAF